MKIDEQCEGDVTIIRPQGPIAGSDAENFRAQLARLVSERPPRIILDATTVSFMDSEALEAIAETTEQLIRTGEALKLVGVNEVLHEVLELTELAPLFEEYEDLSSCLTAAGLTGALATTENHEE